jgi:hypothetical protein
MKTLSYTLCTILAAGFAFTGDCLLSLVIQA